MSFWNKISKSKQTEIPVFPIEEPLKIQHADDCKNHWTTEEISPNEKNVADLIYQMELTESKIDAFLNFTTHACLDASSWSERGFLNFPGPFYTGETDTCGTGIEAPHNVIFCNNFHEHVMIQPRNTKELLQLCTASAIEVLAGYYCDGNKHWTVSLVKEWWNNKERILKHLENVELINFNCNQEKRYRSYLLNEAETDLRKYCFFLEHGYYPAANETLPEI